MLLSVVVVVVVVVVAFVAVVVVAIFLLNYILLFEFREWIAGFKPVLSKRALTLHHSSLQL